MHAYPPYRTPDAWKQRELELERIGVRRVYTDDSDILLCTIHAGKITWSGVQRARAAAKDLSVELIIRKELRYMGGPGVDVPWRMLKCADLDVDLGLEDANAGISKDADQAVTVAEAESTVMHSASWGNGHDGSGIEVLNARWVPVCLTFHWMLHA